MTTPVLDAQGKPVRLGRELGRGGEGVVHELPAHADWVAKRYHQAPDAAKQQKLRLMAESIDSPLRNYAAWPEQTLHDQSGAVIGFTMQRIEGRLPIHMLYSPAQRRESFPQARFDFLVFVARNIAAAFATLHEHGHVLGDVNQGNVLVGADSRVILIDCDSFQIQVGEALHRCEVGVAHFTPPELQSITSFEDITRTPNHDGFGLALLIFHLLMGGRHPYSGVPLSDHVGESLEADIRDFRYAYAKDAAQRLIAPPPKSVPIDSLPSTIVELFEQAFTQRGVESRPTAPQWVAALDALRSQLKACRKHPLHVHAGHTADCVWCALERKHISLFGKARRVPTPLPDAASATSPPRAFDLEAMEAQVAKLTPPAAARAPMLEALRLPYSGLDMEEYVTSRGFLAALPGGLMGTVIAVPFLLEPTLLALTIFTSGVLTGLGGAAVAAMGGAARARTYREAYARFMLLRRTLIDRIDDVNEAAGVGLMEEWRKVERELREFRIREPVALASFKLDAAEGQLRRHLEGQLIERWRDPRVSLAERVRLRSAGIESAADFDKTKLATMNLLGEGGRLALIEWKQQLIADHRRKVPSATTGLAEFTTSRFRQQQDLEQRLTAIYAKIQRRMQQGSLVLQAHRNQIADLERDLRAQHARCIELAKRLPNFKPAREPRGVLPP